MEGADYMMDGLKEQLAFVNGVLTEEDHFRHAISLINFDMETICPREGMSEEGELLSFLDSKAFALRRDPAFVEAAEALYEGRDELEERDRVLAESLHREYVRTKNISAEENLRFSRIMNQAYVDWIAAKEKSDFSLFAPSLSAVRDVEMTRLSRLDTPSKEAYDDLLSLYERGMTVEKLDEIFGAVRERLVPMLKKIMASPKKIRRDFASRKVDDLSQQKMAEYLLDVIGFDKSRGVLSTTEHPFTESPAKDDTRVTTHYYPDMVLSNIYSIVHEGGHALFDMNQPRENWEKHITGEKTMGQHESVSRFYENRIGRSEAFISLIYPKMKEIFPELMCDVSERELYEVVNLVEPSLIRTEADEFTYTFHIMIRYEIEKMIVRGEATIEDLPKIWNDKYEEYLGVRPERDAEGILQDVHWTSGFGYFPTYALGNFYNAMYFNRMAEDLDIEDLIRKGNISAINDWMREHVWKKADLLSPAEWIKDITGRDLTPDDFLDYLEAKYSALYELS